MDNQYNSQPVRKSSDWVLQKWRRPKNNSGASSSSGQAPNNEEHVPAFVANRQSTHQRRSQQWAIPDDESDNWSPDVVTFYNDGDSPFCYSGVFYTPVKLDKRFWGALLGARFHGYLTEEVCIKYDSLLRLIL